MLILVVSTFAMQISNSRNGPTHFYGILECSNVHNTMALEVRRWPALVRFGPGCVMMVISVGI